MLKKGIMLLILSLSFQDQIRGAFFHELALVSAYAKGYAIAAEAEGLGSIFKNPAGLVSLSHTRVMSTASSYFNGAMNSASFSVGIPLTPHVKMAVSLPIKHVDSIPKTSDVNGKGVLTGYFDELETSGIVSFAALLDYTLSIGINVEYLWHRIDDKTGSGVSVDLGIQGAYQEWRWGLSMENAGNTAIQWTTGYRDRLPRRIHAGISRHVFEGVTVSGDSSWKEQGLDSIHLGTRIKLSPSFFIQAGLHNAMKTKRFSIGTQLILERWELSYAFSQHEQLGIIHKIGMDIHY